MSIFYNPSTRPNAPQRFYKRVEIVTPDSSFYQLYSKKAYANFRTMMSECSYSGFAFYWHNTELVRVEMHQPFEFVPVNKDNHHESGINWGTEYFNTKEEAEAFWDTLSERDITIQYNPTYDVYSVRYHY